VTKAAKRYEALAAWAQAQGYPRLRGATVHSWLKRGIPLPVIDERPGFGQRVTREPDETYSTLLAACRYRYDYEIRAIGVVGLLVWLDGVAVDAKLVREGLIFLASNPDRLLGFMRSRSDIEDPSSPTALAEAAGVAFAYHPELADRFPPVRAGELDRADLAIGVSDLLGLLSGVPLRPEPEGVRALARLLDADEGLTPDVLRHVVSTRLRPEVLIRRIRRITLRALERARERALERLAEVPGAHPMAGVIVLLSEVAVGHLAPQRVK
jgi:hypothetical protein